MTQDERSWHVGLDEVAFLVRCKRAELLWVTDHQPAYGYLVSGGCSRAVSLTLTLILHG